MKHKVLAFIEKHDASEADFNALALEIFTYQYNNNKAFQLFCRQKGRTDKTVKHWRDIPAVPVNGFKEFTLSCVEPQQAEAVFMTSGTTDPTKKGKHYHPDLDVYDRSMIQQFRQRMMQGKDKMTIGVLFPTEQVLPNSSLAHYCALAVREFGSEDSAYYANEDGLDFERLANDLERAMQADEPLLLLGATFSFVYLLDWMKETERTFQLPLGSKLMDTGGVKGHSRDVDSADFYTTLSAAFNVPRQSCINMYGMTELSTQFYDDGNETLPSVKSSAHWIRTRVVNPLTGEDVPHGETGVLVHCDLANYNTVTTILTEDAGQLAGDQGNGNDSFYLLGRVQGAEAKGCSLALEDFISAVSGQ